jgi:hypothetical protein
MECAPGAGQVEVSDLTRCAGLSKEESHCQLIRVWVEKYEAGALDNSMSALPPKADMCSATRYVR